MSNIDRTRFVDISEDDFEIIKCGICLAMFDRPLVTSCCQQSYCSVCIKQWIRNAKTCPNCRKQLTEKKLTVPPRFSMNMINNKLIYCEHKSHGCDAQIKLGDLSSHLKCCQFSPHNRCQLCGQIKNSGHNCVAQMSDRVANLHTELQMANENNAKLKEKLNAKKAKIMQMKKTFHEEMNAKQTELNRVKEMCEELQNKSQTIDVRFISVFVLQFINI